MGCLFPFRGAIILPTIKWATQAPAQKTFLVQRPLQSAFSGPVWKKTKTNKAHSFPGSCVFVHNSWNATSGINQPPPETQIFQQHYPLFLTKPPPLHNRPSANQFPPQSPLSPRTASHQLIEIGTFNLAPQPASFRWWMAVDECNWTLEKRGRKQKGWWGGGGGGGGEGRSISITWLATSFISGGRGLRIERSTTA